MRVREPLFLLFIFIASFFFHLWRINYPPTPVFDEAHFATYSAEYARHEAHFDIHPPLGKLLYAAVLSFYPSSTYAQANFIAIDTRNGLDYKGLNKNYADFPYVALRILSSLFGALLPVLGYLLLKNLTGNPYAPPIAALFLLFENALLMETRLILLNGMLLVFGILALIFFFGKKQNILLAGICLGLALSIKLSAIIFGFVIFFGFTAGIPKKTFKDYERDIGTVGAIALLVLMLIVASHFLIIPPIEQISVLRNFGGQLTPGLPPTWNTQPYFFRELALFFKAFLDQLSGIASGYLAGADVHVAASQWFSWPFMNGGFAYSTLIPKTTIPLLPLRIVLESHPEEMGLVGNLFVWLPGTIAIFWSIWFFVRSKFNTKKFKTIAILLAGWAGAIIPFVSVVKRVAFLYHYFPALIFSSLLLAYWLGVALTKLSPVKQKILLVSIVLFTVGGFILAAPYTYGL